MENKIKEKSANKKNILVLFTDPITKELYNILSKKLNIPAINGSEILKNCNGACEELRQYQKVLVVITIRDTHEYLKKIMNLGFKSENITLFTTYTLEAEVSKYAKKKGISTVLLPMYEKKLEDFLRK